VVVHLTRGDGNVCEIFYIIADTSKIALFEARLKLSPLSTSLQILFRTNSDKLGFHTMFCLASTTHGELSGTIHAIDGMCFIRSGDGRTTYSSEQCQA
jgi:hypothetical protein